MSDTPLKVEDAWDRTEYVTRWSVILKCPNTTWDVACHLINVNRNCNSAVAVCFGLSWIKHREYLKKLTEWFENYWHAQLEAGKKQVPPVIPKATPDFLYKIRTYYITDIAKYPNE